MQFLPVSLCINTRRYINTHFATFCKSFDSHLLIGAGRSAFARWQHGEKIVSEAAGVLVKQELHAVGVFLASQRNDNTGIVLLVLWQLVGVFLRAGLDSGPLAPEVEACGSLDQLHNIGATYASSGFEEVKAALVASFDELHVRYAAHHAKGADHLLAQSFQGPLVLRLAGNGTGCGNAALVKYIQRRAPVLVGLCKDNLPVHDKRIDVIDLTRNVAFQQVE